MTTTDRVTERVARATVHADAALERLLALKPDPASQLLATEVVDASLQALADLAADPVLGPRLAVAGTTVEVRIVGVAEPASFSVLLDRRPIEAFAGRHPDAEITLYMTPATLAAFWAGELHAAIAITDGQIAYEGPVRKALRILPLVRRSTQTSGAPQAPPEGGGSQGASEEAP